MTRESESGQALLVVLLALGIFMLGALGLGIDGAQMYAHRQMAQAAADSAAQAAVMSILRGTNATSAHPFSTSAPFTCATADARTPCVYARDNGFGTASDTVTVSFPSTLAGVTLQPVAAPAVTVTAKRTMSTGFIGMLGVSSWTVTAKASAGIVPAPPSSCIYVLDAAAQDAFNADTQSTLTANCPLSINSNDVEAAVVNNSASVTASAISITGGYQTKAGGTFSLTPVTGKTAFSDPLAAVPAPIVNPCDFNNYQLTSGTATLTAGTYCGGIKISSAAVATFKAGVYVIENGSLSIDAATATGSNVTFYLTSGTASVTNKAKVTFAAPTTGAYLGMLFFEDRSSPGTTAVIDNSTAKFTGTLYLAGGTVRFDNSAVVTGTAAIVADQVSIANHASVNLTYDSTGAKTGLRGSQAAGLVE